MPHTDTRPRPRSLRARTGARLSACAASAAAGLLVAAAPAAAARSEPATLLALGSRGAAVSTVQRALHMHASGRFGAATRRHVRAFQREHRLQVDGIVGPQTWDALFHLRPSTATSSAATTSYSGGYSIPSSIVMCESGGNWNAVNPSSGAGGAYQILPSTWAAYGGQGLPQDAPPAQQSAIASRIWASQGPGAWSC
jgi:peptidoglycan hydrolase-like protein with peptidoglycan-binding domain